MLIGTYAEHRPTRDVETFVAFRNKFASTAKNLSDAPYLDTMAEVKVRVGGTACVVDVVKGLN